jgi:acetyl-CoA decarbonylase/synthase complex subunit delta
MAFQAPVEEYNGKIREVVLGGGEKKVTVGGETALPFYLFEGEMPHLPAIAFEVYDSPPSDWPEAVVEPYKDVLGDPVKWALKCQDEYKADMICLQLQSTNPTGENRSAEDAAAMTKAVADAVTVPLIVYGSGSVEKDAEVLPKVAQACQGKNVLLGPVEEDNYKTIAAAAMGFGHNGAAHSPIDVNMAKQLNILVTQLGLDPSRVVIDPTSGALGYGLEYCYSVMERLRLAALTQNDSMVQMPMISNLGKEVWKAKEAKTSHKDEPTWGDAEKRGILWEAMTAIALIMAGSDILVMRHPRAVELVRQTTALLKAD